jgi:hypothetical protein
VRLICDKCGAKSIGGLGHLNQQCSCCYQEKSLERKTIELAKKTHETNNN